MNVKNNSNSNNNNNNYQWRNKIMNFKGNGCVKNGFKAIS